MRIMLAVAILTPFFAAAYSKNDIKTIDYILDTMRVIKAKVEYDW